MESLRFTSREKVMLFFAALGAGFMTYLLTLHYSHGGSSFCNFGAGFSCQIVNQSLYSEILGVPVSALGLAYFTTVILAIWLRVRYAYGSIAVFTTASLVFSFYLTFVEARLLGTYCLFCEGSKVLMLAILGLAARQAHAEGASAPRGWYGIALIIGAAFTGAAYLLQR